MHPGKQRNDHDHYTDPSCQPVRLAATRTLSPFSPARNHISASSWARISAGSSLGKAPSNTISFLVLQRVQAPRTTKVLKPPLALVLIESRACRHETKRQELSTCGVNVYIPKRPRSWWQNCCWNTQPERRWWMVSSSCSQRGHCSGRGSPLLGSLPAVQQRLWATRHRKNLHFFFQSPGSSNGQISCLVQSILAWKVDLVANCPEASNCHLCTSSTSSCNITSWTKSHTARNSKRTATEWWLFLVLLSFEFGCRSSLVMLCISLIMMIRM